MKRKRSLKSKLVFTHLVLVFIILLIFEIAFITGIKDYYYGNVELLLKNQINTALDIYDARLGDKSLENKAKFLLESDAIPDYVNAQIVDTSGNVIESTSRFPSDEKIVSNDYLDALGGNTSVWYGRSEKTDEYIMTVSSPMYKNDYIYGVIRFASSLENVNEVLFDYYSYAISGGLLVLALAFVISLFLASRVVEPLVELKTVANNFARGDFNTKASVTSNDELGDLSEAFNYMAEEIKSTDDIKNEFISSISHEIRTPLTSIMAWSETLLEGGDEEEQTLGLEIISKESKRLTGLVETLLDFSKLEAKRIVPEKEVFDIKELIDRTASQFLQVAKKNKITMNISSEKESLEFYGDKYRIKQVLINIIDNAIKHSYNGSDINISLYLRKESEIADIIDGDQNLEYIIIQIDDEGEGILPSQIDKLTDLFYKGNEKKSGSGIGLAVSKKIVDMHGGRLIFTPVNTGGTSVRVELPKIAIESEE